MKREKLKEAIAAAAAGFGYAFHTGFEYRIAPELKRLPAVWLHPPQLEKAEGREEGVLHYSVRLDLLKAQGRTPESREACWGALEADAVGICRRLGVEDAVRAVTNVECTPAEMSLTAKNELSVSVKFKVQMPFCRHCDCG